MPDLTDLSQEQEAEFNANALAEHFRNRPVITDSRTHCIDCETEIPINRRLAVKGCDRCINCQELLENWRPI